MDTFILYIIKSSVCLAIGYLFYQLLFSSQSFYFRNRVLIISVFISSLLLPLHNFHLSIPLFNSQQQIQTKKINPGDKVIFVEDQAMSHEVKATGNIKKNIDYGNIFIRVYVSVSCLLLLYFSIQIISTIKIISASDFTKKKGRLNIFHNNRINYTFTFFRNMVINPNDKTEDEINNITMHENVHAMELHTIDNLFSSLLISLMWFNPFVWLLHRSLKQVHEYAADNYVISNGPSVNEYRNLLLSIITEERLADLSSTFNNSQIKKRFAMMTKKSTQHSKLRILWAIPIFTLVFVVMAFLNPEKADLGSQEDSQTNDTTINYNIAVAPQKMNVLYLGVNNPVQIAVAGIPSNEIHTRMTNGAITQKGNGQYFISPRRLGNCIVSIYHNDQKIGEKPFRIKKVPNPIAKFAGKSGGPIEKEKLLSNNEVLAVLENFVFDLEFKVVEFSVSAQIQQSKRLIPSKGNLITKDQHKFFEKLNSGDRFYIENIKAVGPDGSMRELPPLSFEII